MLVSALVFTAVLLSLIEVTGFVGQLRHSATAELTFISVSHFVNATDWQVNIRADAVFSFLLWAVAIRSFIGLSALEVALVVVGHSVSSTHSFDISFTEEADINAGGSTNSFVEFLNSDTIQFAFVIVCGTISSTDGFEVMGTATIVFAESATRNWSVNAVSNAFALIGSHVDTADGVFGIDFEGTETASWSWPGVVVVSTFTIFHRFDVGALGTAHVGIGHTIRPTYREEGVITRTSHIIFTRGEVPIIWVSPPLCDNKLGPVESGLNLGGVSWVGDDSWSSGGRVGVGDGHVDVLTVDAPAVVGLGVSGLSEEAFVLIGHVIDTTDFVVNNRAGAAEADLCISVGVGYDHSKCEYDELVHLLSLIGLAVHWSLFKVRFYKGVGSSV